MSQRPASENLISRNSIFGVRWANVTLWTTWAPYLYKIHFHLDLIFWTELTKITMIHLSQSSYKRQNMIWCGSYQKLSWEMFIMCWDADTLESAGDERRIVIKVTTRVTPNIEKHHHLSLRIDLAIGTTTIMWNHNHEGLIEAGFFTCQILSIYRELGSFFFNSKGG